MEWYDLGIAWDWEYDADFVSLLESSSRSRGMSLLQMTPGNVQEVVRSLYGEKIMLHTFFDRASDTNAMFVPIVEWAAVNARRHINAYELAHLAWDKERMHKAISIRGYTPATIVLPSYNERPVLPAVDLGVLGTRFTVKPANGGGGVGVVNGATSMEQVLAAREQFPSQKYLVQSYVVPARFDSRRAWFRVIYCMGKVYSCWWDLDTHVYTPVTSDEEDSFGLTSLAEVMTSIAEICRLELFSSEIALTEDGRFVSIDYVNDPVDLRLQSKALDGVPDAIVSDIVETIVMDTLAPIRPAVKNRSMAAGSPSCLRRQHGS
jgi:hypothetical protein